MEIYQSSIELITSNFTYKLSPNIYTVYRLNFTINQPIINLSVKIYSFNGEKISEIVINQASEITIDFYSLSKIEFSDNTDYTFYISKQIIQCNNKEEVASLFLNQKFILKPLSDITLAKDSTLSDVKNNTANIGIPLQDKKIVSPIGQDTNGNIGIGLPTGALDPRQIRALDSSDMPNKSWLLGSTDNPDMSVNQTNNFKTDIGAGNLYAKDATVNDVVNNTSGIGTPLQNGKIPVNLSQDTNGNIGIGLPTGALDPRQIRALDSSDMPNKSWLLGSTDNPAINQYNVLSVDNAWNTGFAFYNPTGYFGSIGDYVRININLPANNGYIKIKKIFVNTYAQTYRYRLSDDIGMLDNIWINWIRGINVEIPITDSKFLDLFKVKFNVNNGGTTATSITPFNSAYDIGYEINYDRTVNNNGNSSSINIYVELLCDQNNGGGSGNQNIAIEYEGNGSITFSNTLTGGSTGGGTTGGGGGGCWSDDSIFISRDKSGYNIYKEWKDFKIGDEILTINGFEKIEEIIDSGMHELIKISDNLWITPLQEFIDIDNEIRKINEKEYQNLPRKYAHSSDCKVKSVWIISFDGIKVKDLKIG